MPVSIALSKKLGETGIRNIDLERARLESKKKCKNIAWTYQCELTGMQPAAGDLLACCIFKGKR